MRKTLLFLILLLSVFAFAQDQQLDSMIVALKKQKSIEKCRTLNSISDFYFHKDPVIGLKYADEAFVLASKIGYEKGKADALLQKGRHLMIKGDYEKSLATLDQSRKISLASKDACSVGMAYMET
ncbi:hypothetical protein HUK80_07040 [Flavobacterium sp. MAH-1]|uniref:Uncharacterized protein n=1 Tax=Flavobacterium agri TaxID=2743471 RepID=A0A7Y9C5Q8_9FLAO|nr:hypothetical protein [Flavobacterium agri]NUY80645.1 hypothetical protein [Flavobacterium agri]NYA70669.1 hypothetical protein [Flavobacterium agri]